MCGSLNIKFEKKKLLQGHLYRFVYAVKAGTLTGQTAGCGLLQVSVLSMENYQTSGKSVYEVMSDDGQ
jgi:hypothetical protein